jgi:OOP family OmpA-OmpF porin
MLLDNNHSLVITRVRETLWKPSSLPLNLVGSKNSAPRQEVEPTKFLVLSKFIYRVCILFVLLVVVSFSTFSQLAEEMTIRYDLRRTVNGRYQGLAFGETRMFVTADPSGRTGTIFQYRLDELARDGRLEARLVRNRDWTEFEFRDNSSHFGAAFATPHSARFGALYVPPNSDVLPFQNFLVRPPEALREGLVWQAPGAFLTDPRGLGPMTRIPILVEYRVQSRGEYLGRPVWVVSTLHALRYRGDDPFGDPTIIGAQGRHQGVVYYLESPFVEDQRPIFARITAEELYQTRPTANQPAGSIEQRGFYLLFFTDPLPFGNPELLAQAPLVTQPGSDQPVVIEQPRRTPLEPQNQGLPPSSLMEAQPELQPDTQLEQITQTITTRGIQDVQASRVPEGITLDIRNLLFVADQAVLLPGERDRLDTIAAILQEFPGRQFLITGHTADVGSAESQMELSIERARSILNALTSRGIDSRRLLFEGRGGTEPVGDNRTEEGRQQNRRVEITIIAPRTRDQD